MKTNCLYFLLMFSLKGSFTVVSPGSCPNIGHVSGYSPSSSFSTPSLSPEIGWKGKKPSSASLVPLANNSHKEIQDLKEQLVALRCQVGCSLQLRIQTCSYTSTSNKNSADVKLLLPGKDLFDAQTKWRLHYLVVPLSSDSSNFKNFKPAYCPTDVLCQQTEMYEAKYQTEHNDHKHTLQENQRLRKKREEMRQQVTLLQEQVHLSALSHTSTFTHVDI